ncbi:CotH kinase family protein [Sphingobacterium sp. IITKGP-BTPF85]|uniref:CotH kinase family protein n=1 Tax=Sphingobacterium sp. IITKGP-BTPF85 TaxID=1338009 RepID=UPI0003FAA0D5|nr:CotH kinase family protein [Sphingobacterium sp. IITKGP-BTPF85]KKX48343.1 hypothetical protein L950_0221565 [Sphingobacterium sp. IITKGP-BTPF85]
MANKKQFPKDFSKKVVNNTDVLLVADTAGNPALIAVGDLGKDKVDKENNKSLVLNLDITKLQGLPTNTALNATLTTKVDKVEGKGLSKNDYTDNEKAVVAKIKTSGSDNKYLNENGEYKEVIVPKAPVQSIEVNGEDKAPDANGKVAIEIPKAPVQSISLNQNPVTPDSAGNVNIEVVQNVEQTINPASTDPVSSQAVASAFAQLNSKYGTQLSLSTVGDEDNKKYSISLLDEEGNVLSTTEEFSGGGNSNGSGTTTKVILTKLTANSTVKKGDEVKLQYQFDHVDTSTDSSTGNTGKAIVSVISGALNVTSESIINAGSINTIDVTKNLQIGNNSVKVRVEVNTGETIQVSTITYTILVVNLQLNSNMDIAQTYVKGAVIYVPFTLQGAGVKTLKTYVKGVLYETRTITQSSATGTISIPTNIHNHGNLSIQLVAELDVTSNVINSNSIFYNVAVIQTGNNTPIVCTRFDYIDGRIIEDSQRPTIIARQFEDFNINYAVFDPKNISKQVTVSINNSVIATSNVSFSVQKTTYKSVSGGTFNGKINTGSTDYIFGVLVANSNVDLQEPTDELVFKFNASGKSNNDLNKETWLSNNSITATLNNFKWGGDGWLNNALKITDDAKAIINYQPLNATNRNINNSFTYQIKYKISEVTDDNAILISCVDSEGTGFVVTATEAKMLTKGKATVSMKMAENNVYNIAFISHPVSSVSSSDYEKLNSNMLYLYINGIMSGGVQRGTGDDIYQATPTNILLGGLGATIEIFNTRHYNRYLSDSQALDLFIVDLDNVDEVVKKYDANKIIDGNGNITVDSIADDMRYVIVTGVEANGVATLMQAAVTNNKKTKYNVTEILHVKKSEPNLNFRLIGGYIQLQGTSSLAYPIKNYKISLKNAQKVSGQLYTGCDSQGNGGELQAEAKWSFKNKNSKGKLPAKVDLWCLKADYAESSSSHNTGMTALTNDALVATNSLTPAQKYVSPTYEYDVRTTVDGEPCYLFYRKTLEDTPVFLGKYNWNNDKATESVFGFVDIPGYHNASWVTEKFGGASPVQCWEFLNNDYSMGSYLDDDFDTKVEVDGELIPNWTRVFESRFPDNQDIYTDGTKKPVYLEAFVKWVKSTQNNPAKFKAELKNYMDVKHLCDYYMFTDLLGAVDQRVKNCMIAFFMNLHKIKCWVITYFMMAIQ